METFLHQKSRLSVPLSGELDFECTIAECTFCTWVMIQIDIIDNVDDVKWTWTWTGRTWTRKGHMEQVNANDFRESEHKCTIRYGGNRMTRITQDLRQMRAHGRKSRNEWMNAASDEASKPVRKPDARTAVKFLVTTHKDEDKISSQSGCTLRCDKHDWTWLRTDFIIEITLKQTQKTKQVRPSSLEEP